MIMRRRPLLRAAAVAGGAYVAGKRTADRRARDEQAYAEEAAGPAPSEAPPEPGSDAGPAPASLSDQLGELMKMRDQGVLTDEEFSAAKAKLLGI